MDENEAIKTAAFLKEYLKQGTESCTLVLTRDMLFYLYKTAKLWALIEEKLRDK